MFFSTVFERDDPGKTSKIPDSLSISATFLVKSDFSSSVIVHLLGQSTNHQMVQYFRMDFFEWENFITINGGTLFAGWGFGCQWAGRDVTDVLSFDRNSSCSKKAVPKCLLPWSEPPLHS